MALLSDIYNEAFIRTGACIRISMYISVTTDGGKRKRIVQKLIPVCCQVI